MRRSIVLRLPFQFVFLVVSVFVASGKNTQHNDTQDNDTKHNDTQHNDKHHNNEKIRHSALNVCAECCNCAMCRNAECHRAKCRDAAQWQNKQLIVLSFRVNPAVSGSGKEKNSGEKRKKNGVNVRQ
jgi:hypothetical protein